MSKKIDVNSILSDGENLLNQDLTSLQKTVVQNMLDVIKMFVQKVAINSSNSSLPPSKDGNKFPKKEKTKGIKRKPGGQNGHKGNNLKKVDNPDKIVELNIDRKTLPEGDYKTIGYEIRQVFDIEISCMVTEYRAEIVKNEKNQTYVASFPKEVTQTAQYGTQTKATSVYMSQFQLIPLDRVRSYFNDHIGLEISKGSIANFNLEAAEKLDQFENWAKVQLKNSVILHADETGININGKSAWLHTLSSHQVTLFHADEKRGQEAMDTMAVLPFFKGTLCHDHWKSYFHYSCEHSLCNAHHLRELQWALEFEKQAWAKEMKDLLLKINNEKNKTGSISEKFQTSFLEKYRKILKEGETECPIIPKPPEKRGRTKKSKSRNLLERLKNFEKEVLLFMRNPDVPFTNNEGERSLRMTKVQQKISGCFRSMQGAKNFCRVRSYLVTCIKNNVNPIESLNLLFQGKLPAFILQKR